MAGSKVKTVRPKVEAPRSSGVRLAPSVGSTKSAEADILQLQRDAGNKAVAGVLQRLVGAPNPAHTEQKHKTIKRGDIGEDVKTLQMKLGRKSFRDSGDQLDGKFGPKTHADAVQFQKTHGLVPDGIVGQRTWNALDAYTPQEVKEEDEKSADELFAAGLEAEKTMSWEVAVAAFTQVLAHPATSSAERRYSSLAHRGHAHHNLGRFGLAIADYTRSLEAAHIDTGQRGVVLKFLQRAQRAVGPTDPLPEGPAPDKPTQEGLRPNLVQGASGPAVETLQTKLFSLQLTKVVPGPTVTGVYGTKTARQVALVRSQMGLIEGSHVDADVWHALDTYTPLDKGKADSENAIAASNVVHDLVRTDPNAVPAAAAAAEPLFWTPELKAFNRLREAQARHLTGAFEEAIDLYREALELPRLERAGFDDRNGILESVLLARRRAPVKF